MTIKLVVADLDRTLLNSRKELSPRTIRTLQAVQKQGIPIVFASARHYLNVAPFLKDLPADYLLCSNGAGIFEGSTRNVLWTEALPLQLTLEILAETQLQKELHLRSIGGIKDYLWSELKNDSLPASWKEHLNAPVLTLTLRTSDPAGYQAHFATDKRLRVFTYFGEDFISILSANASKFHGMTRLLQMLVITPADIVFFGDDQNDVALLEWAGTGVAVANAIPAALAAADQVTLSNDQEGVADWLEKHLL